MKVLSVLAVCAVLFFAVTYSSPSESEEQIIEQDDEKALAQDELLRYLMAMDQADEQAAESQLTDTDMATFQSKRCKKPFLIKALCRLYYRFKPKLPRFIKYLLKRICKKY